MVCSAKGFHSRAQPNELGYYKTDHGFAFCPVPSVSAVECQSAAASMGMRFSRKDSFSNCPGGCWCHLADNCCNFNKSSEGPASAEALLLCSAIYRTWTYPDAAFIEPTRAGGGTRYVWLGRGVCQDTVGMRTAASQHPPEPTLFCPMGHAATNASA